MIPVPLPRDIHLPPAPGWWPPAPGWWLLAALVLAALWWLGRHGCRRRRIRSRRRQVLARFDRVVEDATLPPGERLGELSALLRRAALAGAAARAGLTGEDWLRFLDGDDPARPFSRGPGRALLSAPYRPDSDPAVLAALGPLLRKRLGELLDEALGRV